MQFEIKVFAIMMLLTIIPIIFLAGGVSADSTLSHDGEAISNVGSAPPPKGDPCGLNDVECDGEIHAYSLYAPVTAYSEIDSCHYPNCAMASGKRAYVGAIACPREIKLGTKVEIDGQDYTCEDRTAKYLNGRFDVFIGYGQESYDKAIIFGKQNKEIIVYEQE